MSTLPVFSKTLFYLRENHPVEVGPQARELLVGALEGVALQEKEVAVERDSAKPPRWVTVTVNGQRCTRNIAAVDAPWSLRSGLQETLRFVQAHLGPAAPAVDPTERLVRVEIAATNGMLTTLDGRSVLLDAETYRTVRAGFAGGRTDARADGGAIRSPEAMNPSGTATAPRSVAYRRLAPGSAIGYVRIESFGPGVSVDLERALAKSEADRVKGLVLDLRDNTGGLLDEAVKVADSFIKDGRLGSIVGKERHNQQRKEFMARNDGHEPSGALVVLVNHRTAAASELVAAAIKNLGRGIILGDPTVGAASIRVVFDISKGSLQRTPPRHSSSDIIQDVIDGKPSAPPPSAQPEPDNEPLGLLLTTGRLLASGGTEIEGAGVTPDIQPACLDRDRPRPDEDCLLKLAQNIVDRARDPQRATLLSTAKELTPPAALRP